MGQGYFCLRKNLVFYFEVFREVSYFIFKLIKLIFKKLIEESDLELFFILLAFLRQYGVRCLWLYRGNSYRRVFRVRDVVLNKVRFGGVNWFFV